MIKNELEKVNDFITPNLNDLIFTQLITYINNMKDFEIDIRIIIKIVDEFVEKYNYLNEDNYNALLSVICKDIKKIEDYRKEYKDNPEIENQLYNNEIINDNENVIIPEKKEINQNDNKNEKNIDKNI